MPRFNTLTRELFEPDINPADARRALEEARDVSATYEVANLFGNSNPRPPKRFVYDKSLRGSPVHAWYLDSKDVKDVDPYRGAEIERIVGTDPIQAYNPDILKAKNKGYIKAVDRHEKAHGGQQGKQQLKKLHARTAYGTVPLGEMLIEGGVEWALERRGHKVATRYMEEMSDRKPTYSVFRDFVYELEGKQHGVMRQIYKAASRAGPRAAARIVLNVPGINQLLNRYAAKLYSAQPSLN